MSFNDLNLFPLERDPIPLFPMRQKLVDAPLPDVEAAVRAELMRAGLAEEVHTGQRIAITAGSRGIASIPDVLRAVASSVKSLGAEPFLVPAMGSHGGATAVGQIDMLASLGIAPESIGAPILSSMETVRLGFTDSGIPVYLDRHAAEADGILVVNRIKQHTDYSGPFESGLMKMISIGLGKRDQAEVIHAHGTSGLRTLVPEVARFKIEHSPIRMGLALFEDARDQLTEVRACRAADIEANEKKWLEEVRRNAARLPFETIDLLIVDRVGKDISGAGMDTRVIGRMLIPGEPEPDRPQIERIVGLDLTEATHGNAIGVGLCDVVTRRMVDKIDWNATYINSIVSNAPQRGFVPIVMPDDRSAIDTALTLLSRKSVLEMRIVRISSTLDVENLFCSEALLVEDSPTLTRVDGEPVWV